MKKSEVVDIVFTELGKRYGNSTTELQYETPFQLLICVMLSAQTTDKRVNMITPALFKKYPDALSMSKATAEDILPFIRTVNYANSKSRHIAATAKILATNSKLLHEEKMKRGSEEKLWSQNDMIPSTFEGLVALPGVGEKTAKVLLNTLFGHKVIAVDTHVHRVSNRLWLVKTTTPLQTSKQLEKIVPEKYKSRAHHGLIFFGRYTCVAVKPHCSGCPFQKICPYFVKVLSKNHKYK